MTTNDLQKALQRRNIYFSEIEGVYLWAVEELMALYRRIDFNPAKPFVFSDYKNITPQQREVLELIHAEIYGNIKRYIGIEWGESNAATDTLVSSRLGAYYAGSQFEKYFNRNESALNAFLSRKNDEGLTLSKQVWRDIDQFGEQIEMAFDLGFRNGTSSATLSREIRQYLEEPDMLFRRVRDEHGVLHLSERAKAYHPGAGRYRSSYLNSLRMTATTTNMAYREADYERWQNLDFVVGYRISRSGTNSKPCDVCSALVGDYPKWFKFVGFHPWCLCFMVPILMDMDEFAELQQLIIEGEDTSGFHSKDEVQDLPDNFTDWLKDNRQSLLSAKSKPYFIKDNLKVLPLKL